MRVHERVRKYIIMNSQASTPFKHLKELLNSTKRESGSMYILIKPLKVHENMKINISYIEAEPKHTYVHSNKQN